MLGSHDTDESANRRTIADRMIDAGDRVTISAFAVLGLDETDPVD